MQILRKKIFRFSCWSYASRDITSELIFKSQFRNKARDPTTFNFTNGVNYPMINDGLLKFIAGS